MSNLKGLINQKLTARTEIEICTIDFLAKGNVPTVAAIDYSTTQHMSKAKQAKEAWKHNTANQD